MTDFDDRLAKMEARQDAIEEILLATLLQQVRHSPDPQGAIERLRKSWLVNSQSDDYAEAVNNITGRLKTALMQEFRVVK